MTDPRAARACSGVIARPSASAAWNASSPRLSRMIVMYCSWMLRKTGGRGGILSLRCTLCAAPHRRAAHTGSPSAAVTTPSRCKLHWPSGSEQVLQDTVPLTMMPMQRPEAPQGGSEAQGGLQLTLLDQPGEGSPQVLLFALKSLQPLLLFWAEESVLCLFCQPQVVGRVCLFALLHKAFVHEGRDRFEHICFFIVRSAAYGLRRLQSIQPPTKTARQRKSRCSWACSRS